MRSNFRVSTYNLKANKNNHYQFLKRFSPVKLNDFTKILLLSNSAPRVTNFKIDDFENLMHSLSVFFSEKLNIAVT